MDSGFGQELGRIARRLGIAGDTRAPRSLDLMTSDGVRLRANDWGGDSSPVLLLHGGSLTARTWDYVCVGLRDRYRMLTIDQRGHGESGWSNDYSVARLAMDAVEAVEQLAGGPARLVGMSLGGLAAAEAAALRPDLLVSLSIVDVAPGVSYEASANMRGFMTGMIGAPSVEAVVEAALRASPQSDPERLAYRMRAMLRQNDAGLWIWKRDGRRMVDFPQSWLACRPWAIPSLASTGPSSWSEADAARC
jgi:pimeloyl-ACP methyl ester carboxylesterase